ncbi:unnamed protein product [Sphagnum jensenii]|uniref:Uncharacterized protein n=1 Tax=Sphagnum jensenii TaxID=128206 RepID=A0ABP0VPL6_9BRYO
MQRSSGVPSSHRPPRPPYRNTASQMGSTLRDKSCFRDMEKGDKVECRFQEGWAIHLIPVVLLICIFVLYICSSLPFEAHEIQGNGASHIFAEKSAKSERHLQEASMLQVAEEYSFNEHQSTTSIDVEQQKLNLPIVPQMLLRGVAN